MVETERKLNGVSVDHDTERDSVSPKPDSFTASDPEAEVQAAYIPVVLDKSSLPNSPDPTQLQNILESPVLGYHAQSPPITNLQIQKLRASEPLSSPTRQETLPPANLQRKTSISVIAKEATEAIGRKLSLRSRRKNSQTGKEWKLEDIPKRKTSNASMEAPVTAPLRSAIPEFPAPPTTTPLRSAPASAEEARTAVHSASPPASPVQFMMRNDSVSEVSTAMTPTSMTFDSKNTTAPLNIGSASPPIPTRHPHHSPKPSASGPQEAAPVESPPIQKATRKNKVSASFISLGSSRPSTAGSDQTPKTPQYTMSPMQDESPQLPSIPSAGFLNLEDEMSQMWLQHDRKGSQSSPVHKRNGSLSSLSGGILSKVTSSIRNTGQNSQDQRPGSHSRQASKGAAHSRTASQPGGLAATFLAEAEEEKAALRRQLRQSVQQIVELELKLHDDQVDKVDDRLEGTKDALAGIETEREIAMKELKVLLKHRYALQDSTSTTTGVRETCDAIVKDFELSLEKLKDSMRDQIREYTAVRAQLVEETSRLRTLRDNYLEEAQHLNKKNDELADLNNDIQRNMDRTPNHSKSTSDSRTGGFSLFSKHRRDSPTNASISSVQSIVHPMFFESKKSMDGHGLPESPVSRASESTVTADTESTISKAVPTRVSDQDSVDLPPPPKKMNYWRKNTAALTGKAVKGFKSVWAGDSTTVTVTPAPGTIISSPQLISSSSQANGLNILLPQPSPAPTFESYQSEYYKSHSFHPKAFKRWQKCGFCGEKLSGTEVRCIGTLLSTDES